MNSELSNFDIDEQLKHIEEDANMVDSRSIHPNTRLEDIFDNRGHAIVWHPWNESGSNAHWLVFVRKGNNIYHYDSFGKKHNILKEELINICKNNKCNLYANNKQYQKDGTSTCGRHACAVVFLNKHTKSFKDIENILDVIEKNQGLDEFLTQNEIGSRSSKDNCFVTL